MLVTYIILNKRETMQSRLVRCFLSKYVAHTSK